MQQEKATKESGQSLPMPEQKKSLIFERLFAQDEFNQISFGLIPYDMDDKWFIFMEDMQLSFH